MASTAIASFFGFFFWTIAARLYTASEVGLASTLISSVTLLVTVSSLGFGIAFMRFLPTEKNKKEIINPCLTSAGFLIIILSFLFCLAAGFFAHELFFLRAPLYLSAFSFFALFTLQNGFLDSIYISQKVVFYTFLKNLIQSVLKVILLFPLVFLGTFGIFSSFGISIFVSFSVSFFIFMGKAIPGYSFRPGLDMGRSEGLFKFAFANYIAGLLGGMASMVFPLIITGSLSPEMTAYFYVAWMIGALIHVIPNSVASNFLAEGAGLKDFEPKLRHATRFTLLLLLPEVAVVVAGAHYILLLFGESYAANGSSLLRIMAASSFFVAINSIGVSRLNLKNKIYTVVFINAFFAVTTIGVGYFLLFSMGLAGIGTAFLLSQGIVTLFFLLQNVSKKRGGVET